MAKDMELNSNEHVKKEYGFQGEMTAAKTSLPNLHLVISATTSPATKRFKQDSSLIDNNANNIDKNDLSKGRMHFLKASEIVNERGCNVSRAERVSTSSDSKDEFRQQSTHEVLSPTTPQPTESSVLNTVRNLNSSLVQDQSNTIIQSKKPTTIAQNSPVSATVSNSSNSSLGVAPVMPHRTSATTDQSNCDSLATDKVTASNTVKPRVSEKVTTNSIPIVTESPHKTQHQVTKQKTTNELPVGEVESNVAAHMSSKSENNPVSDNSSSARTEESLPSKSTKFHHLHHKYIGELEYMLREFHKLERQLLGAKTQNTVESAGSRERCEKLHSFILHLEETIQQIVSGCEMERTSKPPPPLTNQSNTAPDIELHNEAAEVESIQKLEEHILSNLLPVKVRLKRQLAAQQGAKHNPAGMPVVRGGMQPLDSGNQKPKATFLRSEPPQERRPLPVGPVGPVGPAGSVGPVGPAGPVLPPLDTRGSCLTQKIRGPSVSVTKPTEGPTSNDNTSKFVASFNQRSVVTTTGPCEEEQKPKPLYAGMSLGSTQIKSSVTTAGIAHKLLVQNPSPLEPSLKLGENITHTGAMSTISTPVATDFPSTTWPPVSSKLSSPTRKVEVTSKLPLESNITPLIVQPAPVKDSTSKPLAASVCSQKYSAPKEKVPQSFPVGDSSLQKQQLPATRLDNCGALSSAARTTVLGYEERRRMLKKRRKKKKRNIDQSKMDTAQGTGQQTDGVVSKRSKKSFCHRGPRNVEYICALCNEVYNSTCDYNPWWALTLHDCPKCTKMQIPRIDISAPANAIEYHPALLAHADENNGVGGCHTPSAVMFLPVKNNTSANNSESESDLSDDDGLLSDGDDSLYISDSEQEDMKPMTAADIAENEKFGIEYGGPKLSDDEASRLLILMLHASTCPGHHRAESHNDVCRSTKWMMLHVRDCPGTTSTFDVCPFPWCRKVKHLLYHLVACELGKECHICSPSLTNKNMQKLRALNEFRLRQSRASTLEPIKPSQNISEVILASEKPSVINTSLDQTTTFTPDVAMSCTEESQNLLQHSLSSSPTPQTNLDKLPSNNTRVANQSIGKQVETSSVETIPKEVYANDTSNSLKNRLNIAVKVESKTNHEVLTETTETLSFLHQFESSDTKIKHEASLSQIDSSNQNHIPLHYPLVSTAAWSDPMPSSSPAFTMVSDGPDCLIKTGYGLVGQVQDNVILLNTTPSLEYNIFDSRDSTKTTANISTLANSTTFSNETNSSSAMPVKPTDCKYESSPQGTNETEAISSSALNESSTDAANTISVSQTKSYDLPYSSLSATNHECLDTDVPIHKHTPTTTLTVIKKEYQSVYSQPKRAENGTKDQVSTTSTDASSSQNQIIVHCLLSTCHPSLENTTEKTRTSSTFTMSEKDGTSSVFEITPQHISCNTDANSSHDSKPCNTKQKSDSADIRNDRLSNESLILLVN